MWIILVYRPEADSREYPANADNPFSGIEILGFADTEQGADEMIVEKGHGHPDWHFMVEAAFKS